MSFNKLHTILHDSFPNSAGSSAHLAVGGGELLRLRLRVQSTKLWSAGSQLEAGGAAAHTLLLLGHTLPQRTPVQVSNANTGGRRFAAIAHGVLWSLIRSLLRSR